MAGPRTRTHVQGAAYEVDVAVGEVHRQVLAEEEVLVGQEQRGDAQLAVAAQGHDGAGGQQGLLAVFLGGAALRGAEIRAFGWDWIWGVGGGWMDGGGRVSGWVI